MFYSGYLMTDFFSQTNNYELTVNLNMYNKETVYDLYNSSVNNCFGVKCNDGLIISHNCYTKPNGMMINVISKSERINAL